MTRSTARHSARSVRPASRGAGPAVPDPVVLRACDPPERVRVIENYVRRELGRILLVPPAHRVDTARPLGALGVGPVTALSLKRRLEAAFGVGVGSAAGLREASASALAAALAERIAAGPDGGTGSPSARPTAGA